MTAYQIGRHEPADRRRGREKLGCPQDLKFFLSNLENVIFERIFPCIQFQHLATLRTKKDLTGNLYQCHQIVQMTT